MYYNIIVDCVVGMWSGWSRKGNAPEKRTRVPTTNPSKDGLQCPHLEETREIGKD